MAWNAGETVRVAGGRERDIQAASFGAAALAYQRARPSYPAVALDWLLPHSATRVLDLGAGTGQLTRALLERELDVVAVEPSEGMRAEFTRALPDVTVLAGSAEDIPLPDASVDVVLCAQAWHWVDVQKAVPEVARVLRPGGRLGLLWNVRDDRATWTAALEAILATAGGYDMGADDPTVGDPFPAVERCDVAWTHTLTPDQVLDLVASRSYVITLPAGERDTLMAAVADLLRTHPDLAGRQTVDMPYLTRCSRTSLKSDRP